MRAGYVRESGLTDEPRLVDPLGLVDKDDVLERKRSLVSATVLLDARFLSVLRSQFGRHCELADRLDDGRVRVRLAGPTALTIAEHLAGRGTLVEVVEPESVQAELARIGSELTQRYAG